MPEPVQDITPSLKLLLPLAPLPGFEDFLGTYLFHGKKKALVDCGPKVAIPGLINAITAAGFSADDIDYIILTHIHIDHGGGIGTALRLMKNARVIAHPRGYAHLIAPAALWKASLDTLGELAVNYGEIEPAPEEKIVLAEEGMKLDLGNGVKLEILMTPGHAAHHLSVFETEYRAVAAGDAAGVLTGGALRISTPPPLRVAESVASLDKLIALNPKILCYAHLGGFDNAVGRLKAIKTKLISWYEVAQQGVKAGKDAEAILEDLKEKEPWLGPYISNLNEHQYKRDYPQFVNSIRGLMGSPPL